MAEQRKPPFHSFSFWMLENDRPRTSLRLTAPEDPASSFYLLRVSQGPASRPTSGFKREVPFETAEAFRDVLQRLGVHDWQGSYGDTTRPGSRRWALSLVFQKDVFSVESKGGSDGPAGFDELLEELYSLDFPRSSARVGVADPSPENTAARALGDMMGNIGSGNLGAMSAGDLGAYAATQGSQGDFSFLRKLFGNKGIDGQPHGLDALEGLGDLSLEDIDGEAIASLFGQMQQDPAAMQQRMREEFKHLSPQEQESMLDALAASGYASRAWWERFLRG